MENIERQTSYNGKVRIKNTFNFTNKILDSSKKEIIDLKSITRKELLLNNTHKNKVLICKLIERPCKMTSIQCLIEDNNKEVLLACFYNFKIDKYNDIFKFFKNGQKIAIIEPYLKTGMIGE